MPLMNAIKKATTETSYTRYGQYVQNHTVNKQRGYTRSSPTYTSKDKYLEHNGKCENPIMYRKMKLMMKEKIDPFFHHEMIRCHRMIHTATSYVSGNKSHNK